jgi:stage II sporulation protein M
MDLHISEIFSKAFFKEYFHRNRTYIIISCILLFVSIILGIVFSEVIKEVMVDILKEMLSNINDNNSIYEEMYLLFTNNIRANLIILLGGLLFSIISILAVIVNGLLIGFTYTLVTPIQFIVGIFPHGIFELPAIILSLVGAFIIMKLEINLIDAFFKGNLRLEWKNSTKSIQDILFTVVIIVILLVIAAIIEGGLTPTLLNMVI